MAWNRYLFQTALFVICAWVIFVVTLPAWTRHRNERMCAITAIWNETYQCHSSYCKQDLSGYRVFLNCSDTIVPFCEDTQCPCCDKTGCRTVTVEGVNRCFPSLTLFVIGSESLFFCDGGSCFRSQIDVTSQDWFLIAVMICGCVFSVFWCMHEAYGGFCSSFCYRVSPE